jgi:hypothetical protein
MAIAFWVIGLITLLIMKTQDYKYIFLLSVYGMEVVLTIIERLLLKENIFEAHRRHLYQLLPMKKSFASADKFCLCFGTGNYKFIFNTFTLGNLDYYSCDFYSVGIIYLALKWSLKNNINYNNTDSRNKL